MFAILVLATSLSGQANITYPGFDTLAQCQQYLRENDKGIENYTRDFFHHMKIDDVEIKEMKCVDTTPSEDI